MNKSEANVPISTATAEQRKIIVRRIAIGIVLFFTAGLFINMEPFKTLTYISAVVILGFDTAINAVKRLVAGEIFNEWLIALVSSLGLLALGKASGAVSVMLFFQVLKYIQNRYESKSRKSLSALTKLCCDHANVMHGEEYVCVKPQDVTVGDIIVVKSGERVPLDGLVLTGEGFMDTRAFTAESVPRAIKTGSEVLAGSINSGSPIYIKVTRSYENSTASKINDVVNGTRNHPSRSYTVIKKISRYYSATAVILSVLIMLIPPLSSDMPFTEWIYKGLIFMAVSGTSSLLSSVVSAFISAIGRCSADGILIKGGKYSYMLAKAKKVVFGAVNTLIHDGSERSDSIVAVSGLSARRIKNVLITEMPQNSIKNTIDHLGIEKTYYEQSISDALAYLKYSDSPTVFIGDCEADKELIRYADVGITLGEHNTAQAIDTADIIFMTNEPSKLIRAIDLSRRALRSVKMNFILSLLSKLAVLILSVTGHIEIWSAVLLDSAVSIFVMSNSIKILRK